MRLILLLLLTLLSIYAHSQDLGARGKRPPKELVGSLDRPFDPGYSLGGLPSRVLLAVLKHQLDISPKLGKVYIFSQYVYTLDPLYRIYNGGHNVIFLFASWVDDGPASPISVRIEKREIGQPIWDGLIYKNKVWTGQYETEMAYKAIKYKNGFIAHGTAGAWPDFNKAIAGLEEYTDLWLLKHPAYELLPKHKANCLAYVKALVKAAKAQYQTMEDQPMQGKGNKESQEIGN